MIDSAVSGIAGVNTSADAATTSSVGGNADVGKDEFMTLLLAQLQHQDPMEPMGNTEFISQLAQFSELDEMRKVAEGQEVMSNLMTSLNNFGSVALLGREVEFSGDEFEHREGSNVDELRFALPSDAARLTVNIYNDQGVLVRTIENRNMDAGLQSVSWNGMDDHQQLAPPGSYHFEIEAADAAEEPIYVDTIQTGKVEAVECQDGFPYLSIDGQWVPMDGIFSVKPGSQPDEA